MDRENRYVGRGAYLLLRLEAGLGLLASCAAAAWHVAEIRWPAFVFLFAWIDLVGYLPGAIAFRRARGRAISRVYPALYNLTHSFVGNAVVALAWILLFGPEWALVAIPIHLLGDRALFGNFPKSYATPFEPRKLPQFAAFERSLAPTAEGVAA